MFSFIRRHRKAFTVLELLISAVLLGVIGYAAWDSYSSGGKAADTAGDYLSAMQGATILMEMLQEDIRQMAVLNELGYPLIPSSVNFSKHGKSVILRKSSLTDTSGEMGGSSFTAVAYQLVAHPTEKECYTVRRIERATDGRNLPGLGSPEDERQIRSLLVKDIRFDLMVKFEENVRYRTFVRVSITATNTGAQKAQPRIYLVSNVFEATSPEFIHNFQGQVGFARRFILSTIIPTNAVVPGRGMYDDIPNESFPELYQKLKWDYVDTSGQLQDFPDPPGAAAARDPFDTAAIAAGGPLSTAYIKTGVDWFKDQLGSLYRGRVLVQVNSRPATNPPWTYGYSLDATKSATETLATQLTKELKKVAQLRGAEGVEQMGHAIGVQLPQPAGAPDTQMISPQQAGQIAQGG